MAFPRLRLLAATTKDISCYAFCFAISHAGCGAYQALHACRSKGADYHLKVAHRQERRRVGDPDSTMLRRFIRRRLVKFAARGGPTTLPPNVRVVGLTDEMRERIQKTASKGSINLYTPPKADVQPEYETIPEFLGNTKHLGTVVFLHGVGSSGERVAKAFAPVAKRFPHIKFVFPCAEPRSVKLLEGGETKTWFDLDVHTISDSATALPITEKEHFRLEKRLGSAAKQKLGTDESAPGSSKLQGPQSQDRPDSETLTSSSVLDDPHWSRIRPERDLQSECQGIEESVAFVHSVVSDEIKLLNGESRRVIVGGFSCGGATALLATHAYGLPLGGALCLSGYLAGGRFLDRNLSISANRRTPLLMTYGAEDPIVPIRVTKHNADFLRNRKGGTQLEQHDAVRCRYFKRRDHSLGSSEEMRTIELFLNERIPRNGTLPKESDGSVLSSKFGSGAMDARRESWYGTNFPKRGLSEEEAFAASNSAAAAAQQAAEDAAAAAAASSSQATDEDADSDASEKDAAEECSGPPAAQYDGPEVHPDQEKVCGAMEETADHSRRHEAAPDVIYASPSSDEESAQAGDAGAFSHHASHREETQRKAIA